MTFVVADDDLSSEDLLAGHTILKHIGVDSITLLKSNSSEIGGAHFSTMNQLVSSSGNGSIVRLIIPRLERRGGTNCTVKNCSHPINPLDHSSPRVNYYQTKNDVDSFPDPYLMEVSNT